MLNSKNYKTAPTLDSLRAEIDETWARLGRANATAAEMSEGLICRSLARAAVEIERALQLAESKMGIGNEAR